jgi:hypothetical protein
MVSHLYARVVSLLLPCVVRYDLINFVWPVLRLAPLLDFANHGLGQKNEPQSAGLGIFGGKGISVVADRDIDRGEEVRELAKGHGQTTTADP